MHQDNHLFAFTFCKLPYHVLVGQLQAGIVVKNAF